MEIKNCNEVLGDMYVEKDNYVLTHKEFTTIEDLHKYLEESTDDDRAEKGDIFQVITVEELTEDEDNPFVVSFESVELSNKECFMSIYTGSPIGLILYHSYNECLDDYTSLEDIEEECARVLKSFIEVQKSIREE